MYQARILFREENCVGSPSGQDGDLFPGTAGMMARSTLDVDTFQQVLAKAFMVQQSLMDVELPSAMLTVQHLMAAGEIDVNGAMHLIAGRARNVANATGVAIGLLKGDQLVYRAGSGSASRYIGRHVMATLSVPAKTEASHEILRVEDAQTDTRIGAEICRQFGAKSLLILPIYDARALTGVLEVFFSEAHAFQDREVCIYQVMARVVGEALAHAVLLEQKEALAAERSTIPQAIERITHQVRRSPSERWIASKQSAVRKTSATSIGEAEKLPSHSASPGGVATRITYRARRLPMHMRLWRFADRAAVVIALGAACWIAYSYRRPVSPLGPSAGQRSSAVKQQVPFAPQKLVPAETDMSKPQTASVPMEEVRKAARSTPRRVRVGDDEIDDISDDVTVRHFIPKPARHRVPGPGYWVDYISEDVTVRHFTPKLAVVSPSQPGDRGADSANSKQ